MKIKDMNWMQVEEYLKRDKRAVIPVGSTEQHGYLSLMVDCILSERMAADAAETTGVPVFPTVNYGVTPYFRGFPGSISLRIRTYLNLIEDILNCMFEQGFRNIVIVNGHGGNMPAATLTQEWMIEHPGTQVKFHNWYNAPKTWKKVQEIDPVASHASWMENFPWTRLEGVIQPSQQKQMVKFSREGGDNAQDMRRKLGDGNFGGYYERPDSELMALWDVAVQETREIIETGWK